MVQTRLSVRITSLKGTTVPSYFDLWRPDLSFCSAALYFLVNCWTLSFSAFESGDCHLLSTVCIFADASCVFRLWRQTSASLFYLDCKVFKLLLDGGLWCPDSVAQLFEGSSGRDTCKTCLQRWKCFQFGFRLTQKKNTEAEDHLLGQSLRRCVFWN